MTTLFVKLCAFLKWLFLLPEQYFIIVIAFMMLKMFWANILICTKLLKRVCQFCLAWSGHLFLVSEGVQWKYIYKYIHMKISIYKIDKCNAPFFSFFLLILFGHSSRFFFFFFFNKTFSSLWTLTASYCLMDFYHNWSKCKHMPGVQTVVWSRWSVKSFVC